MDEPAMDLLSLPDNFKLQIFKKLDWKSLKNLKLVCRDLYFLIEQNILSLDRPKAKFSNDDEYGNFLKNMDFTKIAMFYLYNVSERGSIWVRRELLSDERYSSICNVSAELPKGTSRFKSFHILILSNRKLILPYNGDLFRMQSLRRLGIFERNKPSLVIKKIIMDILIGNPMLEYENASTDTRKPLYIQITNHMFELGLLNPENRCDHKGFI
uniref:F-box domain-containing protein n=1 Tax=Strongyloides papillosus TaxID=174720 RepID=A0A0N5B463_STREA